MMQKLDAFNFKNETILLRVDYNVPLDKNFNVTDCSRIEGTLDTIHRLLKDDAKIVLITHLGRPEKGVGNKYSLKNILETVENVLGKKIIFLENLFSTSTKERIEHAPWGTIFLLENIRYYPEETEGDLQFAGRLAQLGTFYINDAFGTAHRAHASTCTIAQYFPTKKCFGLLMQKEIDAVEKILQNAEKPFLAIIGGAKISSKITIIETLLDKVDAIIIGGGMAFTFLVAKGYQVGKSLIEENYITIAKNILEQSKAKNTKIYLPVDFITTETFSNETKLSEHSIANMPTDEMGLDIGSASVMLFKEHILASKTILWNGPMGVFEFSNFQNGTLNIANFIIEATEKKGAYSLVGGGDSVAAIKQFNLEDKVSYVSTGGGALLEYLEGKILPGIQAILN